VRQAKICDERGRTLPPGEVGEVYMRLARDHPLVASAGGSYKYIGATAKVGL
jgi:hypothetical protein